MIVAPVPTSARSRHRRALARLAPFLPVALLAGVVGVAVLGGARAAPARQATPVPASQQPAHVPLAAAVRPAGSTGPLRPAAGLVTTVLPAATPAPPTSVDGIAVEAIPDVIAAGRSAVRPAPVRLLAIEGYLGTPSLPTACGGLAGDATPSDPVGALGPLCTRQALLAAVPWSLAGSDGFAGIGPHLHLQVPVGVRLPSGIERTTLASGGGPLHVVVIGRLDPVPAGGCPATDAECDVRLLLDDVAWSEPVAPPVAADIGPVVEPGIDARVASAAVAAIGSAGARILGDGGTTLVEAVLRAGSLARVDSEAAAAVAAVGRDGVVGYVRGLPERAVGEAPGLEWAVADGLTGRVLALGREPGATYTPVAPTTP